MLGEKAFLCFILLHFEMNRLECLFKRIKVSDSLKIAIFPYLRFQRFQIDMLENFL